MSQWTFSLPLVIFCHIYRPHPHGITVVSDPITTILSLTLSPFPRYYRNFGPHYRDFTADLPLSPFPCSSTPQAAMCVPQVRRSEAVKCVLNGRYSLRTCCYRRLGLAISVAIKWQCSHGAQCAADARSLHVFCTRGFLRSPSGSHTTVIMTNKLYH